MNKAVTNARLSKRQQALLGHIRTNGKAMVEVLAQQFSVTPQTIRRDLKLLCDLRLLMRVHGGAVSPGGTSESERLVNLDYSTRCLLGSEAKDAIGKHVASIIPNDASLFINIGTTTERVAQHLIDHIGIFVITNNINIANTLRRSSAIKVMTAGGVVRHEDGGIVGHATEEFISQFKVDFAVISCSALEPEGTLLDFDIREVRVTQAIINNARSVILAADASKFTRKAPVRLGNLAMIDYFVTDETPPPAFIEACSKYDTQVIDVSAPE